LESSHRARAIERRYIDGTNVLQTRFYTATEQVVLADFMLTPSEEQKEMMLFGPSLNWCGGYSSVYRGLAWRMH
jgi:hypothetical protein